MSAKNSSSIQKVISKEECNSNIKIMKFPSFDSICGIKDNDNDQEELANIEEQAKMLLLQTQSTCEELINKAQIEAENIKKDAFQSGYNNGIANAKKEVEEAIKNVTKLFTNAVNQLSDVKDEIIKNAENDIIELTLAIAKKLVCSELRQNPDLIIDIIKDAIKTARTDDEIIIRINPQDRMLLEQNSKELIEHLKSVTFNPTVKIIFEDDSSIINGGCIVITDKNIVDMTFESRFESILETINSQKEN